MCLERYLRLAAGLVVTASVLLAQFASPWFLLLAAFAGLNLLQSAFTNWCPLMSILRALRVPDCASSAGHSGAGPTRA